MKRVGRRAGILLSPIALRRWTEALRCAWGERGIGHDFQEGSTGQEGSAGICREFKVLCCGPRACRTVDEGPGAAATGCRGVLQERRFAERPFAGVMDDFRVLIRLVVAYARGHYREIPPDALVVVVAGLVYVVSPVDLIPDFMPGGFADDAAVIVWIVKTVRAELDAFRAWELGALAS